MPLGVISRVHLDFRVIFGEKSQKGKLEKSRQNGLLRLSVRNPRCGIDLCRNVGCLTRRGRGAQNGTPRVRHSVATLRHDEGLHRSVAVHRHYYAAV